VGNGINGVGASSGLQKIARRRFSPGHYRAVEVTVHPL